MTGLEWLTYDLFAHRVGECFVVTVGDDPALPMELAETTESTEPGGLGPDGQERLQFSLVFRGPVTPILQQGTYRLSHAELGGLELFLVPLAPDAAGPLYEAAFA